MNIDIEFLKKLKALSEDRGTTIHEREVAAQKLQRFLDEYEIDISRLDDEKEEYHTLDAKVRLTKQEQTLGVQILCMIRNTSSVSFGYQNPKKRSGVTFKSTYRQSLEFQVHFLHYLKAYRDSLDEYVLAFCVKNSLHPDVETQRNQKSVVDLEVIERIKNLANGIVQTKNLINS